MSLRGAPFATKQSQPRPLLEANARITITQCHSERSEESLRLPLTEPNSRFTLTQCHSEERSSRRSNLSLAHSWKRMLYYHYPMSFRAQRGISTLAPNRTRFAPYFTHSRVYKGTCLQDLTGFREAYLSGLWVESVILGLYKNYLTIYICLLLENQRLSVLIRVTSALTVQFR